MPNWCHNEVIVSGPEDDVIAFVRQAQSEADEEGRAQPFCFGNFVPEPAPPDVNPDWYSWRVQHWGTKWDASFGQPFMALGAEGSDPSAPRDALAITSVGVGQSQVTYEFDTAWAQPTPVMFAAAEAFPTLTIVHVYGEPGNDFGGKAVYQDGELASFAEGMAEEYLRPELMWF